MKIGLEMRRLYDKNKFFEFEFTNEIDLTNFLNDFLKYDVIGEKLELRIWKKNN